MQSLTTDAQKELSEHFQWKLLQWPIFSYLNSEGRAAIDTVRLVRCKKGGRTVRQKSTQTTCSHDPPRLGRCKRAFEGMHKKQPVALHAQKANASEVSGLQLASRAVGVDATANSNNQTQKNR